ncbi:hypothetical protein GLX30_01680 [Streptomyces sp. Tu 2975]|uniref:hypothetical protein n=1 Tax=Streptomyces sp. Tu 2975 TaxID=2676871 RepID=UPI00135B678B|nr:hypothetical protein [Streptomyces sp. Tu 2975]QIP83005.1 hypothetical protein GLX30_01680 [Streptomyces sp. Tu 2975]
MGRRVRLVLATALPAALFGVWSVFLLLTGATGHGAQPVAGPVVVAPAEAGAGTSPRPVAAHRTVPNTLQARPVAAVPQLLATENTQRLPGTPPALPGAPVSAHTHPLHGRETAGPCQERAPPSGVYDPRHTRGPPSTRHS